MKRVALISGLLILLLASYNNCNPSGKGTEIGNPWSVPNSGTPASGSTTVPLAVQSTEVLDGACVTLVRCNPSLTLSNCETGLLGAPNVVLALGLPAGSYSSLSAAQTAEAQGTVTVNSSALSNCLMDLSALSCSSSNVMNAYISTAPDLTSAFVNGAEIFPNKPGSCSNLYN